MRHAFLLWLCSRSRALQRVTFRLQTMTALLIRASTVIHAVNREGVAHVSKEMNCDAITVHSPAGPISTLRRARLRLRHFTPLQRGNCLRSVPPIPTNHLAPWNGMSDLMTRWLRRGMLNNRR
jgi:hypothetical protein